MASLEVCSPFTASGFSSLVKQTVNLFRCFVPSYAGARKPIQGAVGS